MIPLGAPLVAPPGYLLVEREEMPVKRGRIHLPAGILFSTRSSHARVVSVGEGLEDEWAEDEAIYLSNAVGRPIHLGLRGERTLYRITPSVVLARIVGEVDQPIEYLGEGPAMIPEWEVEEASQINEGEPEALR
jgi:hypothetical protein